MQSPVDDPGKLRPYMLAPRYWGTWILLSLLWIIMWLPRTWIMKFGSFLGSQAYRRNSKRRHIAETNIRLCFPELDSDQRRQMVIEHFRNYGRGMVDMGLIMMATKERIEKYSRVQGREHIESLSADQKAILVTYHTTTLDMYSSSMMADIPLVSMMKRDRNPVLNRFLYRARTRYRNARVLMRDQSLRGIIAGMNEGRICYIIPDEDFGDGKHTVFAPFFGQPRCMLNIVSRLAKMTNAVVIPGICRLDPADGHYVTEVLPPLEGFPGDDLVQDATRLNQAMEGLIRRAPEQYLWTFRWFRTQPDGAASPYEAA